MIFLKTISEVDKIKASATLVALALNEIGKIIKPGITTLELNNLAEQIAYENGAVPGFKGYRGFPFSICASRNDEIVHGFPSTIPLVNGDVLSVDFGIYKNGYYGDAAKTFGVGIIAEEAEHLITTTEECLYLGIEEAVIGNRIGDISYAIQQHAESRGYGIVREFVGHGIGRDLHEKPQIPNYGNKDEGEIIKEGMVLAIEPMLTLGSYENKTDKDGWTIKTIDGSIAAHFEHTVYVSKNGPIVLSKLI